MFKFFDVLWDSITLLFNFFINIIESLINLITVLYTSLQSLSMILGFLPPIITTSALLVLSICVLNYLVGRSNQS